MSDHQGITKATFPFTFSFPGARPFAWTLASLASAALVACSSSDTPSPSATDAGGETAAETSVPDTAVPDTAADTDSGSVVDAPSETASDAPTEVGDADAGPPAVTCLAATPELTAIFSNVASSLCLVAQYDVADTRIGGLTWGAHHGPVRFTTGSDGKTPTIVRYQPASGTSGSAMLSATPLTIPGVPTTGAYWNSQAVDLGFFGWTAISYTGSGAGYPGEVILVDGSGALTRYNVNGFFSGASQPTSSGAGGRLLYTGLSVIGTAPTTTNAGGLYAADSCGSASASPRLLPNGDATCTAPQKLATWQAGSSGPLTVDPDGNAFAVLSTFGGNQEMRGFAASKVARGAVPTAGAPVFSTTGYTSEIAATGTTVFYQPYDATSYKALDVAAYDYSVDASAGAVTPSATSYTAFTLATPHTSVSLVADPARRLWVAANVPPPASAGDAGADAPAPSPTHSTFFVFAKKP
jgi:hypothetical protein